MSVDAVFVLKCRLKKLDMAAVSLAPQSVSDYGRDIIRACAAIAMEYAEQSSPRESFDSAINIRDRILSVLPKNERAPAVTAPSRDSGCGHKFVDSKVCLKCGWRPCPECRGMGWLEGPVKGPVKGLMMSFDCPDCGATGTAP